MTVSQADTEATPDTRHAGAQKVFFACFTDRGDTTVKALEAVVPEHKQWIAEQETAGTIFVAGPFLDDDFTYAGSGLMVLRAATAAEAHRIAASDPMHAKGLRTFRIVAWQLNEGSVRIDLSILTGSFSIG